MRKVNASLKINPRLIEKVKERGMFSTEVEKILNKEFFCQCHRPTAEKGICVDCKKDLK